MVLELNIARITKIFPLCCTAFKASILREEQTRKQGPEGLAQHLRHITGATPALPRGGKRFARIAESILYHHQSTNAKRCSLCQRCARRDPFGRIHANVPFHSLGTQRRTHQYISFPGCEKNRKRPASFSVQRGSGHVH